MTIKQTVKRGFATLVLAGALLMVPFALAQPVYAANSCGGVDTAIVSCDGSREGDVEQSGLWGVLLLAINVLTAGIGIAAVGGVVYGIVLYTVSAGDPAGLKKALEVIRNVVIGVLAYALMFSLLQWLVPGGVFNT